MITFQEHVAAIEAELKNAKEKHPDFPKKITDSPAKDWGWKEEVFKERNDIAERKKNEKWLADNIIGEEFAEAFHAAAKGDKENAKKEFYQVIAVALRIIETLDEGE